MARDLLELAALPGSGTMLDVGCGSGRTLASFGRRHPGWRVLGVDVAAGPVAEARARGQAVQACALALPLAAGSVDLVMAEDLLQHLPAGTGRRTLAELARVLRPGGHLFVRTNAHAFPESAREPAHRVRRDPVAQLAAQLTLAGFHVVRIGRVNALPGLAEILPGRRGRAVRDASTHGSAELRWYAQALRWWLRVEGRAVRLGWSWPLGRTMVALCRRRP